MEIRNENWCGHNIRFVEHNGEWWAILKDICDALDLRTDNVANRLDPDMMERVLVEMDVSDPTSTGVRSPGENKTRWMLAVNEIGIYEALFASKRLEARKLRRWTATVLQRLRNRIGLQGYEVMRMTETGVQEDIDHFLDDLFWDEKTKTLMRSVTVAGGDVEQVPFDDQGFFED
jgi:prophage antirepressor-like protein